MYIVWIIVIAGALARGHLRVGHGYYRYMYTPLNLIIGYKLFYSMIRYSVNYVCI